MGVKPGTITQALHEYARGRWLAAARSARGLTRTRTRTRPAAPPSGESTVTEPLTPRTAPCGDLKADALALLERLPSADLHDLRLHAIPALLRRRAASAELEGVPGCVLPDAEPERDEDGDPIDEATPLVPVQPVSLSEIDDE